MRQAGEMVAADIRERTASGRDADGRGFAPGTDGAPVDLRASGQMLDDLVVTEATDQRVRVGFKTDRSERIAALHESGTRNMPARPFVGVSRAMVERVMRLLKARMGK